MTRAKPAPGSEADRAARGLALACPLRMPESTIAALDAHAAALRMSRGEILAHVLTPQPPGTVGHAVRALVLRTLGLRAAVGAGP